MASNRLSTGIERNAFWLCLAITLLAAFLRFHQLGFRSFWFDEAIELRVAKAPLETLWSTALNQRLPDPPLSTFLSRMMLQIDDGEFILRFPSALIGTMAVYAGYQLFRLWLRPAGALTAQALLALAPAQVYYAQETGQYALMVLTSVMIFGSFERTIRKTNSRNLALFTLSAALGMFSHYGLYWLLGGLALILLWRRKPAEWIRWWPSGSLLLLLAALVFVFLAWPQYQSLRASYPPSPILDAAALNSVYRDLTKMAHLFSDFDGRYHSEISPETWFFIGFFLLGLVVAIRKRAYRPAAALFFLPLFIAYFASKAGLYLWGMRYLLFVSPMFYLLLSIGFGALASVRLARWALPVLAIGILLFNQMYAGWPNEELGENMRPILEKLQRAPDADESSIYVFYGAIPAFELYYEGDAEPVRNGRWIRDLPLAEQMADVLPSFNGSGAAWFVASHYQTAELTPITDQLDGLCHRVETLQESNALAIKYLCEADPSPSLP